MIRLFKVAMDENAKVEVGKILDSGYIGQGEKVKEFEAALERSLGMPALTVNSGTSAIDLALHLCNVGPGDEVITTPQTCTATNTMIANRKAQIVWADVDKYTGNIDPEDVKRKVTQRTKAIIAVDWGGRICDFEKLREAGTIAGVQDGGRFAFHQTIPIIEDAAHAFDSHLRGRSHGMDRDKNPRLRGDYIAWSFQAIKHLTTGDGGALHVPDIYYSRAKLLRWYGLDRESSASFRCAQTINEAGYKYHMNDIAAAIGLANLELAHKNVEKHSDNAMFYNVEFRKHDPAGEKLIDPLFDPGSSYWLYTILVNDRDGFIERMAAKGVECSPVHARNDKHPAFRGWSGGWYDGKISPSTMSGLDYFASHEVAIPVGWWLTEADREYVAKSVLECAT